MEYWELSHLENHKISSLLLSSFRHRANIVDKQELLQDSDLIFALIYLINEHHKLPWICHKENFLSASISLFFAAELH